MAVRFTLGKKPSGIYFVEYYESGGRRRVSLATRDERSARMLARDIANGATESTTKTTRPTPSEMSMEQLLNKCLHTVWSPRAGVRSQATVRSNVRILVEMIGDVAVRDMDYTKLEELVDMLYARKYKPGTVHRKMCNISKALTEATKLKGPDGKPILIGKPAMPTISARNSRDRVLTDAEEMAIFGVVAERVNAEPMRDWRRFSALLRFLLDTGCRLGEALNVRLADLETEDGAVYVTFPRYTTKNEKPRKLPLSDAIIALLPYLRAVAVQGRVFPLKSASVWYMWQAIRTQTIAAGHPVADVVLHTMRHTCLTRLARSGEVPIERISDWAGHSGVQVTIDHYLHLMPRDKLTTVAVINRPRV